MESNKSTNSTSEEIEGYFFEYIDCLNAFEQLDSKSKHFSYYFTKAIWEASKVCYFQKSYESPILFYIFTKILSEQTFQQLQEIAAQNEISKKDFESILIYIGTFYNNCGNYYSQGNMKFIPCVKEETFIKFLSACKPFVNDTKYLQKIWDIISPSVYCKTDVLQQIGFKSEGSGHNSYYSPNLTREEAIMIQKELDTLGLSALNTRVAKKSPSEFYLLIASIETENGEHQPYAGKSHFFDNKQKVLKFVYGEYSAIFKKVVADLENAKLYAANEKQEKILDHYIKHLRYGDVHEHKKAQEIWVTDRNPIVETNLGFTETYVDPIEVRGEWEGFIMLKNIKQSQRFNRLTENCESLLKLLPWPRSFEIDVYKRPDFNSVDVLTIAATGIPIGKNLPNYDDVRQEVGLKNINLGNCYGTSRSSINMFISAENEQLQQLVAKYSREADELKVGLHELLGHGSGKLFTEGAAGVKNFDESTINPLTGEKVASFYKKGETWHSVFGSLSNAYEECRADAVALYLTCFDSVLDTFYPEKKSEWKDIVHVAWYNQLCGGVVSLHHFMDGKWSGPHATGRYVILQYLLQNTKGLLKFYTDDNTGQLKLDLNEELIHTIGKAALAEFLLVILIANAV